MQETTKERTVGIPLGERIMHGWLYVITGIGGFLFAMTLAKGTMWPTWKHLAAWGTIILVLHVLEEWKFPRGFFSMYNIQHGTTEENSDRYPMSQETDMLTNFIPIFYGLIILLSNAPSFLGLPFLGLSLMEVIVHTMAGFQMQHRFAKKTIYNPGFITSWLGFFPLFLAYIIAFAKEGLPSVKDILLAFLVTFIMTKCCINGAEKVFKKKDSPYPYTWGKGYFKKFG